MKIAIIDNENYQTLFRGLLKGFEWDLDYFSNSSEFGKVSIQRYDVIISDNSLPKMSGRDLIQSISSKTSAALFLMSTGDFSQEDIDNDHIAGLINKTEPEDLVDQLKYMDAKLRINKYIEEDHVKYKDMVTMTNTITNGYTIKIEKGIAIIGVKQELSVPSKSKILSEIEKHKKCIVFFPNRENIASVFLGLLVSIFKHVQEKKGFMAFWNEPNKKEAQDQLSLCKLTSLFPVFNVLDDAIDYLKNK